LIFFKSENPEEYQTRLHVHVDGSCNGMQHYAAIGRDELAAYNVNLVDKIQPSDVYTSILNLVKEKVIIFPALL
jgi:DNA-directed RNA polymerase, mitochondrial